MFAVVGLLSLGLLILSTNILVGIISHDLSLISQQSDQGRSLAEAGVEEAALRLLRDPGYHGGTLVIDDKNVIISVTGDGPKIITSEVDYFGKDKKIRAEVTLGVGQSQVTNWEEY